jgi:hypothetical protein
LLDVKIQKQHRVSQMPLVRENSLLYEVVKISTVGNEPLPVDIQSATLNLTGDITVDNVTIDNTSDNPVPISDNNASLTVDDGGGSITVDGPLTDAQLRLSAVPVSASSLPLPTGAATLTAQNTSNTSLSSLDTKTPTLVSGRVPVDGSGVTQPVSDGGSTLSIDDGGGSITVDGPITDSQLRATSIAINDGSGSITIDGTVAVTGVTETAVSARTPTTTSIVGIASSVLILAQNSNRKGFMFSNISTSKAYLSFSNPATTTNCFVEMQPGAFLALDQQLIVTNAIYCIWTNSNGTGQVTEFV